jgi:S1-C subfamily serine protease
VLVRRSDGGTSDAKLAYSSWITMRERGERDSQRCSFNDFALVALAPADAARVNPTVPVLGGPVGVDTDGLRKGEPVVSYSPNDGRAVHRGSSLGDDESGLLHYVATRPPGIPGDSGSGFLDGHGAAFGVLSTEFDDAQHSNGVIDLAAALAYASRYGPLGPVALVPGNEPFKSVSV